MREVFAWLGVIAILTAYIGVSFEIFLPNSFIALGLNIFGGIVIAFDAFQQKNYQPAVLNSIWAIVAIIGILQIL